MLIMTKNILILRPFTPADRINERDKMLNYTHNNYILYRIDKNIYTTNKLLLTRHNKHFK